MTETEMYTALKQRLDLQDVALGIVEDRLYRLEHNHQAVINTIDDLEILIHELHDRIRALADQRTRHD